jgi:hypothetical protein
MSDNLRDRVAAVLYERHYRLDGRPSDLTFDDLEPEIQRVYRADADAVIAALGSDCIYRYVCAHCGEFWFDQSERMQRFALLHNKSHTERPRAKRLKPT